MERSTLDVTRSRDAGGFNVPPFGADGGVHDQTDDALLASRVCSISYG
jgi:hypothetical protein